MATEKATAQMKTVLNNQRTGKVTTASDVSDPQTQEMIRSLNKEQARGTNTIQSQTPTALKKRGIQSFAKGGMVKKTGFAKVHKGERVLTQKQNKSFKGN